MPFNLPKGKPEFSKLEESILQYWKENKTFEKSVESRPAENPYRFYDGPPFITGTPHYGSLLSSIIKDVVPRYQTMLGKRVERVWGWDCHGLPIEQKVQKKLGLESNKEIEESAAGIQGFIDECYAYTRDTSAEWGWYVDHIGRWVDMDHAYRTMDQNYMESVMWVFKQIWEKGYIYEGKRVSWYSWKLSTPISNFEIAMDDSYQDVQDPAITVKFPIVSTHLHGKNESGGSILGARQGTGIIIKDEVGKILMIKNKKDNLWGFPGGGVEAEESVHKGALRELLEETGVSCEITPYCTIFAGNKGALYQSNIFSGTVPVGTKVILEEKTFIEHEYFALDALPVRSEMRRLAHDVIDVLTGVREPVIIPEISEPRKVNILAWTTTPWTMPMHMALAVNKELQYVSVYHAEEVYIVAASRVETVFKGKGEYHILGTLPGEELVGLHYNPPFDFYVGKIDERNFRVYHADFVTDTDGTGIAHEAPEFGDVDFQLAKAEGIHVTSAIDEAGKYTAQILDYQGQLYLDCIEPITERLKLEGKLFKKESITHRVPYCPRSNTPLIQKAQKSWFIDIQRIKSELIAQNEHISWFPDHFKHGRFLKSLESAPDWCISRSRFWGTPMPVWQNSDGSERVVIDSREELYERNKPLGQITKCIFVRHAESEGNVAKFFGDAKTPLTENGHKQAKQLIEELKNDQIDVIISSPWVRTMETAVPIAKKLGIDIITDERLIEWNVGELLGNASNTPEAREDARRCYSELEYVRGKTGETRQQVLDRGQDFLREIVAKYPGKTVAIFSHNALGKVFFSAIRDESYLQKNIKNSEVRKFYIDNNTGKEINLHRPYIDRIYVPACSNSTGNKQDTTKVIFLRHAESESNVLHLNDTFGKYTLTELGTQESQDLIKTLEKENVDAIYSSPLSRTKDTITPFAKKKNLTITVENDLREMDHGTLDLVTHDKCEEENLLYYADPDHLYAGGESRNQIQSRMFGVLQKIVEKHAGKTIVIVSHGDPLGILLRHITGRDYLEDKSISPKRAQPIILSLDSSTCKEKIETLNQASLTPKKVLGIHGKGTDMVTNERWKLRAQLFRETGLELECFQFDRSDDPTYESWKTTFDTIDFSQYDAIFTISLGGAMLVKYLAEKNIKIPRIVLATAGISVSAENGEKPNVFKIGTELFSIDGKKIADEIIVVHAKDDEIVPYENAKKIAEHFGVQMITLETGAHTLAEYNQLFAGLVKFGAPLRRIPEVLDVWMDSASMPYAQVHYPFENQEKMEASFPADFIAEYTGQIRAWFYVMHAIGVMVKGSPAFKNVAVTGVINGTDGRKMSKSFGNYPDPRETIEKYGADAIRFYLMGGTLMKGEDMTFSEAGIQESIKRVLLPLWNSYTFFATYANIDGWEFTDYETKKTHELDTWIISRLHTLIQDVRNSMDAYDLQKTCDAIMVFLDGLNNWYIRRNRRRFWRSELDADKKSAYETLHEVLVTMTKLLAPICPFITEHLYQNLMNTTDSVHLTTFPEMNKKLINVEVNQKMRDLQNLTNLGLAIRGREKLRVRQPLRAATITLELDESARETLAEELNVKEVHIVKDVSEYVTITYSPDAKKIGSTERKQWMKTIIADAKAGKGTLTTEGTLELTIPEAPNGKVILAADEFEAVYTPKSGSTIAFTGSAGYVIGLDTTLDEALTFEGYARDIIRGIQDARKELGFQVTDRLQLSLTSDNDMLGKILKEDQGMIEKETLTKIDSTSHPPSSDLAGMTNSKEVEIDEGFIISLTLTK